MRTVGKGDSQIGIFNEMKLYLYFIFRMFTVSYVRLIKLKKEMMKDYYDAPTDEDILILND